MRLLEREQLLSSEMRSYQEQISKLDEKVLPCLLRVCLVSPAVAKVRQLKELEDRKEKIKESLKEVEKTRHTASRELVPRISWCFVVDDPMCDRHQRSKQWRRRKPKANALSRVGKQSRRRSAR